MLTSHKNLIKGTKSAGDAGGQANEPEQQLLVLAELADRRQQLVEIEWLLGRKEREDKIR
jgi:hypothetical protein